MKAPVPETLGNTNTANAASAGGIDEATLLAIVSLVVAILSTLVCVGQVVQQYVSTGSPVRLCDSIVYGGTNGLPGRGRRVWIWRQFRYRVLYDIPRISLVPLAPEVGMFVPFLIKPSPSFDWPPPENKLMSDLLSFNDINAVGEASWVAFSRALLQACPSSVIVNRVTGDADRCPSDMTNIPMPISLRDIAFFCLFLGMECTSASFETGTMAMSGPVGTITSSQHPTLGSCLHYAPAQDGFRLKGLGIKIDTAWILRACGRLRIANVILVVGATQSQPSASGLRSPFEDPSIEESRESPSEKFFDQQRAHSQEIRTLAIPALDYYWMSQMSIVAGFWATPFKSSSSMNLNIHWGATQVVLKVFQTLFYRDENYPLGWVTELPQIYCGEGFITYPPYGIRHGLVGEMMTRDTVQRFAVVHEYVESRDFDSHIPKITVRKESQTPATHVRLDAHYDCGVELMAIDVWLHVVSKTVPIHAGRKQILARVPQMVQEVFAEYGASFETVTLGTRTELDSCAGDLATTLRGMDLSNAEKMYLLVAVLRTAKVGLCIGLGNDSTPLLEIIEKDVQAHLL